jgi:hypothetical protein
MVIPPAEIFTIRPKPHYASIIILNSFTEAFEESQLNNELRSHSYLLNKKKEFKFDLDSRKNFHTKETLIVN